MSQTSASMPTPGSTARSTPKITDSTPPRIKAHSPSISWRSLMAPAISKTPVTIAQATTKYRSTTAVRPGQTKVRIPIRTPNTPSASRSHHLAPCSSALTAATIANTPSTSAKAPNSRMRAVKVMPGRKNAAKPNNTAKSPRRANSHQFLERTGSTGCPAPALASVVMRTPFSVSFSSLALLLVALAQEEQVQQRQQRRQRRRYVGEGRGREHPLRALGLAAREQPVAGQEPVGAGGGVDLHRQRNHVERQHPQEQDGRELDEELARGRPHAHDDHEDEQRHPNLAAESHDRKEPRPKLHRYVAASVLDGVPALVGRHAHRGYGALAEVALREPDPLPPRVVVV